MGAKEVATKAWAMSVNEGAVTMVADPACWSKDDDLPSIQESFASAGFQMVPANNSRLNGLQKLHEMLQTKLEDGRPAILINESCKDWQRTVPLLTADPRNPEDIDTALEDHDYDSTRYAVMSEFISNPRILRRPDRLTPRHIVAKRKEYDTLRSGL